MEQEIWHLKEQVQNLTDADNDLRRRLDALERYAPLLEKTFAGDIGGTSEDAQRVLDEAAKASPVDPTSGVADADEPAAEETQGE